MSPRTTSSRTSPTRPRTSPTSSRRCVALLYRIESRTARAAATTARRPDSADDAAAESTRCRNELVRQMFALNNRLVRAVIASLRRQVAFVQEAVERAFAVVLERVGSYMGKEFVDAVVGLACRAREVIDDRFVSMKLKAGQCLLEKLQEACALVTSKCAAAALRVQHDDQLSLDLPVRDGQLDDFTVAMLCDWMQSAERHLGNDRPRRRAVAFNVFFSEKQKSHCSELAISQGRSLRAGTSRPSYWP